MASNLPFGSGGLGHIASKAHLPTSAPFRVRAAARYPAGYAGRPAEGWPCCPGFPSPYGAPAFASWASCSRQGLRPSLPPAYRRHPTVLPDSDGVSTFRMRELRPGWAPPRPRGQRCSHGRRRSARPPLAVPPRPGPAPRSSSHLPGLWVARHQRGFTHVRPSGLPLACAPGWNETRFGFFPELRTPQLPATHARAGTGPEHWPGAMPPTSPALQSAPSSTSAYVLAPASRELPRSNGSVLTPQAGTTAHQRSCVLHRPAGARF
jgi:hypothetical protein